MIVCPNCNHQNPEGAAQCEQCYTSLPTTIPCPSCGTPVQSDATFCGQCGFNLKPGMAASPDEIPAATANPLVTREGESSQPVPWPELQSPDSLSGGSAPTQLQVQVARLLHVQTNTTIELPQQVSVIHIGKPNDKIPPDVDVSGFPNAEVVSRIHADIRVEGDTFYIEDVGSGNGTYINHTPLLPGNRDRLRAGDRIGLGKHDKVTFIFQLS